MYELNDFNSIQISIASPEKIKDGLRMVDQQIYDAIHTLSTE